MSIGVKPRLKSMLSAGLLTFGSAAYAEVETWQVNMPVGVTETSRSIYDLHMLIFWVCVAIGVVVFGVMFWSILHHRKSAGAKPATFHDNTTVELIWTIIPFFILFGMAVPATVTLKEIYDASEADIDIKITGYQWKWRYEYMGEGVNYFSNLSTSPEAISNQIEKEDNYLLEVDEPLVIPTNKKVRFLITANDVIHAWWVPALAVKKDAIPGMINESWTRVEKPGIYRGQCAELCGKDHGFMPIVVEVKEEEDYNNWLAAKKEAAAKERELRDKKWTLAELMTRGEKVYNSTCAACHQVNGAGIPPAFPALKDSPIAMGPIEGHIDMVMNGKPGTAMQAYGGQLSEVDLAAVVTYERNAWGNDKGDMVEPLKIVDLKAAK